MTRADLVAALRRLVADLFPELGRRSHLFHKARVVAVHAGAGAVGFAEGEKRFSVDLQPLHPDGTVDADQPVIPDVPLDVPGFGADRGVYAAPLAGATVRFGYYGGDLAHPFVAGVVADGGSTADVGADAVRVQRAAGHAVRLEAGGKTALDATSVYLGGESGALEVARKSDAVEVTIPAGAVMVPVPGGPAVPNAAPIALSGTITGGSSVARAK